MKAADRTYLTIKQAATLLGVSEKTLRRWDREGKLQAVRHPVNNFRVYSREQLARHVPGAVGTGAGPGTEAVAAPSALRTNLPPPPGSLVGRTRELAALHALVAGGERLVTVLGMAGVGKTRLVLRYAELHQGEYVSAGGVWFCDLAEATTVEDACAVVCRALDVVPAPGATGEETAAQLGRVLAARGKTLVLLDNFEQLVAHGPALLGRWHAAAPDARLLVTSRERLRLRGEALFDLDPLAVPPPATDADADAGADAQHSEAVALFEARARAVGVARPWSPDDARAVAEIVRRLDGLPLAIELAAARARVLGPTELLARLGRRFEVLAVGPRDAGGRQATLEGAIDASWNALSAWERAALAQCAVFRGDFTLGAAEAVLDLRTTPGAPATWEVVEALCDKSLLRALDPAGDGGERRFGFYLSIREYAEARLRAADGLDAAVARHAAYYARLGEQLAEGVVGPDGAACRRRLAQEHDNLAAVHARALAGAAADPTHLTLALRAVLALDALARVRGPRLAHVALIDTVLAAPDAATVDPALRARALDARSRAHRVLGRVADSRRDLDAALALARAAGDARTEASALTGLCVHFQSERKLDEARACGERALALYVQSGHPGAEAVALGTVASLDLEQGMLDDALARFQRSRALARAAGDPWTEAMAVACTGHVHQERGRLLDARHAFAAAIELFRALGNRRREAVFLGYLAGTHYEQGDLDAARPLYERAVAELAAVGSPRFEGLFHAALGALLADVGLPAEARAAFETSERLLAEATDPALSTALRVHRLHLAWLSGTRPAGASLADDAAADVAAADARAAASGGGATARVSQSDDVRFALRALQRALAEWAPGVGTGREAGALAVAHDAQWFTPPGSTERVDLSRRGPMRRVLLALVDQRLRAPGAELLPEALLARAWPGERVLPAAGTHRVRVAVAALRALGLRDVLHSREGAYLLDPAVPVRREGG